MKSVSAAHCALTLSAPNGNRTRNTSHGAAAGNMSKLKLGLPQGPTPGRPRSTVLVVESDRPIRALLTEWLDMAGYDIVEAHDMGVEPKAAAHCDVVLVDVRAPLRSARQAIAGLAGAMPQASIIAMSADALASGRIAMDAVAHELGVAAVLVKPFDRDTLMQALERARTAV
jgi:CheY-like chemotaxis protein